MKCINDRFAFDDLYKKFLHENYSHEEAKDLILNNYSLSTLVFQERIENNYYKKIKINEESKDLIELKKKIYKELLFVKN